MAHKSDEQIIKEMQRKLARVFDVVEIDQRVTVCWGAKLKSVSMVVVSINDGEPRCWVCGGLEAIYKTTVTMTLYAGGKSEKVVRVCYDCFCPK